jgi:hypothetical protein
LGIYLLADHCIRQLSVAGTRIKVRTVFRELEFDVADVERLKWSPIFGSIRLTLAPTGKRANIQLSGLPGADQLEIIQLFQRQVPAAKQLGWPRYCYKIAMPLRELYEWRAAATAESSPSAASAVALRDVYTLAILFILVSWLTVLIVAGLVWCGVLSIVCWLVLRTARHTIDDQGSPPKPAGLSFYLLTVGAPAIGLLVLIVLRLTGIDAESARSISRVVLIPLLAVYCHGQWCWEKASAAFAARGVATAPLRWDALDAATASEPAPALVA